MSHSCPLSRRQALIATLSVTAWMLAREERAVAAINALPPLPMLSATAHIERAGASIWCGRKGSGPPVILLHGGLASSRSWGFQIPALIGAGYEVILVDSRGHGRSTLGERQLSYDLLADDLFEIIDALGLRRPHLVGWSDGAITALTAAMRGGARLAGVFAFGANMTQASVREDADAAPILAEVGPRLMADYRDLSAAPAGFDLLRDTVRRMQKAMPDHTPEQLGAISDVPVMIAAGASDEFIKADHPVFLADHIPGARLHIFKGTGHFAPWQKAEVFNRTLLSFLAGR